jgi:hypothetical protein
MKRIKKFFLLAFAALLLVVFGHHAAVAQSTPQPQLVVTGEITITYDMRNSYDPYANSISVSQNGAEVFSAAVTTSRIGALPEGAERLVDRCAGHYAGQCLLGEVQTDRSGRSGFALFNLNGMPDGSGGQFGLRDWAAFHDRVGDGNDDGGNGSLACFRFRSSADWQEFRRNIVRLQSRWTQDGVEYKGVVTWRIIHLR